MKTNIFHNINQTIKRKEKKEYILIFIFIVVIFFNAYYIPEKLENQRDIKQYIEYINDCRNDKRYNREKIINIIPYISVCLPVFNMEKYIEQALLSIINQSFQNFEIIVVNDNSKDLTLNILNKMKLEDERIKIINHKDNKGVYYSRIEAVFNSKSQYIILMDPDDMYLNRNLFEELYNYNSNNNLDIIEFTVYNQIEGRKRIFYPKYNSQSHYHNFSKKIIEQPELSKILFKEPNTLRYRRLICRNIWNKMIRRSLFKSMYEYIGKDYLDNYIITADDMTMNLILYQFANNYSNINVPGYMYLIRNGVSMSRGDKDKKILFLRAINNFYYFKIFYKCIKQFKIKRKSLFYEIRSLKKFLYLFKDLKSNLYENDSKIFLNDILNDKFADKNFKNFANEILLYFEEN